MINLHSLQCNDAVFGCGERQLYILDNWTLAITDNQSEYGGITKSANLLSVYFIKLPTQAG